MIINHLHKFIFIHIPKTAGTSMTRVLEFGGSEYMSAHRSARNLNEELGDKWKRYFTFAFVRNPWERQVSWYRFLNLKAREKEENFDPGTFENFIKYLDNDWPDAEPISIPYAFGQQQIDFITDVNGKLPRFVGRFERLSKDWRAICVKLKMPYRPLPRLRHTGSYDYKLYYKRNPDLIEIVREQFKDDIKRFGYQYE